MAIRPKIKTILILSNLMLIMVLIAVLGVANLYQDSLIKQTQRSLLAQAVWIKTTLVKNNSTPISSTTAEQIKANTDLSLWSNTILANEPKPVVVATSKPQLAHQLQDLSVMMKQAQSTLLSSVQLVDSNAIIVASTNQDLIGLSWSHRHDISEALKGKRIFVLRERVVKHPEHVFNLVNRVGDFRVHLIEPVVLASGHTGAIVLSRTPATVWQQLVTNRHQGILYAIVLFALVVAISVAAAVAIERPIALLAKRATDLTAGRTPQLTALEHPITHEAQQLSDAVTTLATKLQQREQYILDFVAELSHELKTPVTSLKGGIELLSEHFDDMSVQQRTRFLANIDNDTERLEHLVSRAIAFAKADHKLRTTSVTPLRHFREYIESGNWPINVVINCQLVDNASISLDIDAMQLIADNLISNAIAAQATEVSIEGTATNNQVQLNIRDNGTGVSEGNADKLFKAFFTTGRDIGGTGLGLPIVASAIERAGGYIKLASNQNPTCFTIRLPIA